MTRAGLVIPCFDEASRLDPRQMAELLEDARVTLVLVDDGSRDGTREVLDGVARSSPRVTVLALPSNRGKAEAVRHGMLRALEAGCDVVGYADADFATPPRELLRLLDVLTAGEAVGVFGSRLQRLGATIERRAARHLVGRGFATLASWALGFPVYDTQCGAKWFRAGSALERALIRPFEAGWAFDVELLARLTGRGGGEGSGGAAVPRDQLLEVPLRAWRDVGGSKVSAVGGARAFVEVARLGWRGRARR